MAESYVTCCPVCEKSLKQGSLYRSISIQNTLKVICQQELSFCLLKGHDQYLKWLAEVVECINSARNPNVPGK